MENNQKLSVRRPLKSVAGALLFCVFLGPVGLLYSSVLGGIILMLFGLLVIRHKLIPLLLFIWVVSCVWGVISTNRYNNKILL